MSFLKLFIGPMKSGKSHYLIQEYNKYNHSSLNIQMFKPAIDNRFNENFVVDRDNQKISSININSTKDLLDYKNLDIFFIDEFQFLKGSLEDIVTLLDLNKNIYIAGLNLDTDRQPFGLIKDVCCIADEIVILKSICDKCNIKEAKYSFCKTNKPSQILIGDEQYLCLCEECYLKEKSRRK